MRIAVIGANGRLGKLFVDEALSAGHTVRAGVRGEHSFVAQENLEIIICDATNVDELRELMRGQEVIVSAIGHVRGSQPDVQTMATKLTATVMQEQGINRFVDVTGTGVRFPGDKIPLIDRILNAGIYLIDRHRVIDGRNHQTVLIDSDLEWTTIRVLKLQNGAPKPFALTAHGPTKWYVGRREVAQAMLDVIEGQCFVRQAPIISSVISK